MPILPRRQQPAPPPAAVPDGCAPASACVVEVMGGKSRRMASAVCVWSDGGESLLLTNHHVVAAIAAHGGTPSVEFPGGVPLGAAVLATEPGEDLALLSVKAAQTLPAVVASEAPPRQGDPVFQVGFGGGSPSPHRRAGTCGGYVPHAGSVYPAGVPRPDPAPGRQDLLLHLNPGTIAGDSGSGIFDKSGKLAGLVWGGPVGGPCRGVPHPTLCEFLRKHAGGRGLFRRQRPRPPPQPEPPAPAVPDRGGELDDVRRQLRELAESLRKQQENPPATPPITRPPERELPPIVIPPAEKPDLTPLQDALKRLEERVGQGGADLGPIEEAIRRLERRAAEAPAVGEWVKGLKEQLSGEIGRLREKVEGLRAQAPPRHSQAPESGQKSRPVAEAAWDIADWAVPIALGAAAPTGLGAAGLVLWRLLRRRRKAATQQPQADGALGEIKETLAQAVAALAPHPRQVAAAQAAAEQPPRVVVAPPQPPMTEHVPVPVPVAADVIEAYDWARKRVMEEYPGMTSTVQMIESLAKQRLSGKGSKYA